MSAPAQALRVLIDGSPLEADASRAFWQRFSAWMDQHPGDLSGFAKAEGLASVHPEIHEGAAVLRASRTAPQQPYTAAPRKDARRPLAGRPRDKAAPASRRTPGGPRKSRGRS